MPHQLESLLLCLFILYQGVKMDLTEVSKFWPDVATDLTLVKWSHATNSKELLDIAIQDSTMMIEADVSIGKELIPIMAHPPHNESDLTLKEFMETLVKATNKERKKGVKLDFKFLEIVEPSLEILKQIEDRLNFPLWLNADILKGSGGRSIPLDADQFLDLSSQYFPNATLSIGYTTSSEGKYTEAQLNEMFNLLKKKEIVTQVTLPLRASLAARSILEIKQFLKKVDEDGSFPTTITIWSGSSDIVDRENLDNLISEVGKNRIYLDVPLSGDENIESNSSEGKIPNFPIVSMLSAFLSFFEMLMSYIK